MRFIMVLNADGGRLRTTDLEAYCRQVSDIFKDRGHELSCRPVSGDTLLEELGKAFEDPDCQAVLAAGGDGTISAAAEIAWKSGKPLGVIPAGTMNLFARSLGTPLDIVAAARALAAGEPDNCDIASANGRPFLHQFSVGFHPRMVRMRNQKGYRTHLGKINASIVAAFNTLRRPPEFPVNMTIDGTPRNEVVTSISVSNNPYGDGHLPYADHLDTGELGIYYWHPTTMAANARLLTDLALGTWRMNPDIKETRGQCLELVFPKPRQSKRAVIDGELIDLANRVEILIHPGELKIIRPASGAFLL